MKPAATISLVIVAVLTTVVIQELRIKDLKKEIVRLGKLPTNQPVSITPEEILAGETKLPTPPGSPAASNAGIPATDEGPGTGSKPEVTPPAELPGLRKLPEDYPKPSEDEIKQAALGPYSALHYDLGLNNQERVYFDDLLRVRQSKQQELAQAWITADDEGREEIEAQMETQLTGSDEAIRTFLRRDEDFELFAAYHAMQPERMTVAQLVPLMDQQGVSLELEDEKKLVAAMHEARMEADGIDWNSAEALQAVVNGDARKRFEQEWSSRTEALRSKLPELLDEKTIEVVMAGREQLKANLDESLESAIEMINGLEDSPEDGE